MSASNVPQNKPTDAWFSLLSDQQALLMRPGSHHKKLIEEAHVLHKARVIDRHRLSDLLEQADGALAFAVEVLLDEYDSE